MKRDLDYHNKWFSLQTHTPEKIVQTICISEIVHEVIVVLSYIPLLFVLIWGSFPVFLITSVAAGQFDTVFVILQKYNRPRLVKLIEKGKKKK